MKVSANIFCNLLMEVAASHGVRTVICSPGSRNAPLLIAANGSEDLQTRVVIDERVAAFIALGEAMVSRSPVMLVCTSGTALLNYAPAVAEAYHAGIPLIVVSADRPMEWIDQDDSQTMRQFEALRNFVKRSYDLPVWRDDLGKRGQDLEWFVERSVNEAMLCALATKQGPVHINIQLDNPLGAMVNPSDRNPRIIRSLTPVREYDRETVRGLAERAAGKKIMIIAGFMPPDNKLSRALLMLAQLPNVCVMAETISNINPPLRKSSESGNPRMIDPVLWSMDEKVKEESRPDLVLSIGGALVSRQLKEFLRKYPPAEHWSIGFSDGLSDPLKALTLKIEAEPGRFLRQFTLSLRNMRNKQGTYGKDWRRLREETALRTENFVLRAPWSDLKAFSILAAADWSRTNLFLSNGTTIRYAQLFDFDPHASFCNRGVSGIEGSTSTATGGALALLPEEKSLTSLLSSEDGRSDIKTVLITGDMSFAYDIGALASGQIPRGMKFIVLNNGGGGIFRYIGSTSSLPQGIKEEYFCASPNLDLSLVSEAFGLSYYCAESENRLRQVLNAFLRDEESSLLEIKTDGEQSADTLKAFQFQK